MDLDNKPACRPRSRTLLAPGLSLAWLFDFDDPGFDQRDIGFHCAN